MPTLSGSTNITSIKIKQGAAPSTPAAGYIQLYATTGPALAFVDPAAGVNTLLTSAWAGSSSITTVGTLVGGATGAGFTVALSTATITGTLADARLSSNVALLNAANAFTNTGTHDFRGLIRVVNGAPDSYANRTTSLQFNRSDILTGYSNKISNSMSSVLADTSMTFELTNVPGTGWTPSLILYGNGNATIAGVLTVSGYGTHTFNGAGASGNVIALSNTNAGAGAAAVFRLGSATAADAGGIVLFGSGYTTGTWDVRDSIGLYSYVAGGTSIAATHASGDIRFYTGGTTLRAKINANGTQTWAPYGAGAATFDASGNITSVSDARFKDRISNLPYGLLEVLALRPVQHGYNVLSGLERDHLYGGFIAQDVQVVMPLAVGQDQRGYLTLADRPILGATVNAIKELDTRLARLEARG